jgi:hypothetical protein
MVEKTALVQVFSCNPVSPAKHSTYCSTLIIIRRIAKFIYIVTGTPRLGKIKGKLVPVLN